MASNAYRCPRCGGTTFTKGFVAGPTGGPWWFSGPPREIRRVFGFVAGGRRSVLAAACQGCGHLEFSLAPER